MKPRSAFAAPDLLAIPEKSWPTPAEGEGSHSGRGGATSTESLQKRVIASHALLMLYGRCKVSDVAMVKDIKQYSRQGDPASPTTDSKPYTVPIMISGESVFEPGWHELWSRARKEASLPITGVIKCALLPVPTSRGWGQRPVSCCEMTRLLSFLLDIPTKRSWPHL